jgi:hypothetical protein
MRYSPERKDAVLKYVIEGKNMHSNISLSVCARFFNRFSELVLNIVSVRDIIL